jgi:anthranilate/para-aminobenzoate synthase component I
MLVLVLLVCMTPSFLLAQQPGVQDHRLALYANRAWQDAAYEQQINWITEDDEMDYWTDQRNFENILHKAYPEGFQVYINNKRAAYREHQLQCGDNCDHGDYYQLQASYYFQNGVPMAADSLYLATSSAN